MDLKIHGLAMSACTGLVIATALEKGAPFDIMPVDLSTGAHKKPEFLALQPFGVIPVLEDGDLKVFESRAIARYISNKYEDQGTPLFGKTLKEKALVDQWLEVESQNYNGPIFTVVVQCVILPWRGIATDESVVRANLEKLGTVLDVYEAHLEQNDYLAGNFFSLADLSHIPFTHYLINVAKRGDAITSRRNVNAWWERISSRPSWKKVQEKCDRELHALSRALMQ